MEPVRVENWIESIFGRGPWWCRGGCKQEIQHPGICDECAEKMERRDEDSHLTSCVESIPLRFRWSTLASELLPKRVSRLVEAPEAVRRVCGGLGMVVISGGAGKGKTSLGCAILREVAGARSRFSWRCRFLEALELGVSRRDAGYGEPDAIGVGKRASVLLLDDVGQETIAEPIREVLHYRHNRAPTIVTTFLGRDRLGTRYDGGMERRLLDGAMWIDLGGTT